MAFSLEPLVVALVAVGVVNHGDRRAGRTPVRHALPASSRGLRSVAAGPVIMVAAVAAG